MAAIAAGVMNGASIIRVHNVKMALDTIKVIDAVRNVCPSCPSEKGG